jgi:hypothetical protein
VNKNSRCSKKPIKTTRVNADSLDQNTCNGSKKAITPTNPNVGGITRDSNASGCLFEIPEHMQTHERLAAQKVKAIERIGICQMRREQRGSNFS